MTSDRLTAMAGWLKWKWVMFGALLAAHTFLLTFCAVRKSACFDEGAHLAAGCAYLKWGEFSIYDLSPPPLRIWSAIPAYLAGANIPPAKNMRSQTATSRHWFYFQRFQNANLPKLARYILWGRLMLIPLSIGVAVLIFFVARSIYGDAAGLVSCAIWCLSPTTIAHGSTIGTDIGFVLGALIGSVWWWKFLQSGSNRDALLASAGIALANVSKFSAFSLWPILIVMAVAALSLRLTKIKTASMGLGLIVIVTFVAMNGAYAFRLMGDRLDDFKFQSRTMKSATHFLPGWIRVPFPHPLVEGLDAQKWEMEGKYPETLFGQTYFGSDWRYYPILLATKLTLPELFFLAMTIISLFFVRPATAEIPLAILAVGIFAYLIFGLDLNNGIRHLLPVMAAMAILIGRCMKIPRLRVVAIVAIAGAMLESALAAPRFHSYCNLFADRSGFSVPDRDWGQSLIDLKTWMNEHNQARITVLNFSAVSLSVYGIDAPDLLSPPQTEYIAIGRRFLNGMTYKSQSDFMFVRPWKRLQHIHPAADLGGLLVYRTADVQLPSESPWVVRIGNLDDALKEPELAPIRNVSQRMSEN